jgi:hypothetical protein
MYDTLESTWGTSNPWEVFGGGPDEEDDMLCSEAGDYGPGNPWDAPGMSSTDFVRGVR